MDLVKICPSCGFVNPATEMMCQRCLIDISSEPPQPLPPKPEECLVLECVSAEGKLTVKNSAVLGREKECREFLEGFPTVSRIHARFALGECWTVEDMASKNGTWINGIRLKPGEKCPLKSGDRVELSKSCIFTVKLCAEE